MRYSIEGGSLPAVVIQLDPGESILSEAGGRTWMKGNVETSTNAEGGFGKSIGRLFSGESLFMTRYTARGPAEIGFASSFPGKILAVELQPGQSIICQKSAFLCGAGNLNLSIHFKKKIGAGLFGGEGFIMQKVTGPGIAFLELDGYCKEYILGPGERLTCDTGVLAVMDETCSMDVVMVKGAKNIFFGGEGLLDTVVTGPGKVCLQTMTIPHLAGLIAPHLATKE